MTKPTGPTNPPSPSANAEPCVASLPSHKILVEQFEVSLLWPVLIQARKNKFGEYDPDDRKLDPDVPGFLNHWVDYITGADQPKEKTESKWETLTDGYPPLDQSAIGAQPYSEFCYFHPFVRNFLYVTRDDIRAHPDIQDKNKSIEHLVKESSNRNMRILLRTDAKDAELTVEYDMQPDPDVKSVEMTSRFRVESCWMYLFDTRIALVELQMSHESTSGDGDFSLRHVLHLQDIVRRLYAPYWNMYTDEEEHHKTGHTPRKMTLQLAGEKKDEATARFGNFSVGLKQPEGNIRDEAKQERANADEERAAADEQRGYVYFHREPHTNAVWSKLLEPLVPMHLKIQGRDDVPYAPAPGDDFGLRFEHIEDDRVPLMSYIGIKESEEQKTEREKAKEEDKADKAALLHPVRRISTGDWMRLAFVDDEGDSSKYPYSPAFFGENKNPLDGFAYDRFWHDTGVGHAQDDLHSTRWLCSGYAFTAVGNASDRIFFANEQSGALCHFRHHYFALTLIAHFHRASLLRYKHRLAEIADDLVSDHEPSKDLRNHDFRQKIEKLSEELMRFTTLYWFAEVSNQVQGIELFNMYRERLNLQTLFDDVQRDIESAASLLRQWNSDQQADASQRLAWLGAIFLVVAPVVGLFYTYWEKMPFRSALLLAGFLVAIAVPFMKIPIEVKSWWRTATKRAPPWLKRGTRWLSVNWKKVVCSRVTRTVVCGGIVLACAWGLINIARQGCPRESQQQVSEDELSDGVSRKE